MIDTLTEEEFRRLPLVVEGESKEVRYAGKGLAVIRYKPTIYSFTANRSGVIPGSEVLRLRASRIFVEVLRRARIPHGYRQINERWVLADLVLQPATKHDPKPFRPADIDLSKLPVAPPIEVVITRMHSGTSKHRYFRIAGHPARKSHPLYAGMSFADDDAYRHFDPGSLDKDVWRAGESSEMVLEKWKTLAEIIEQ